MAVSESPSSPLDLRGAVRLYGQEVYLAEMRGSTESLLFSMSRLEVNKVAVPRSAGDARSLLLWGSAQKVPNPTAVGAVGNPPHL